MSATGTVREESQAMEFSVSKSALLNELNTTQGVVERKTTIPILSNILVEARFNDLPDDFFQVPMPDGVTIHDYVQGSTYVKQTPKGPGAYPCSFRRA